MTGPTGRIPISPVPGYSNLRVLARGGYATVYVATQTSIGREVALKIDTRSVDDERDRRRFLREAQAAGRLSAHPHIVAVYDAGVTGDHHPYLVMELCTGGSYAALLKRQGPMDEREVRDVGVKIARALAAAHSAGILHRDVKPGNILIRAFGEPGLADFGLASMLHSQRYTSLALDALTPAYSAPEVFKADRHPTPAADVYSLGATLYAMLTGRPPRWPATGTPSLATVVMLQDRPIPDIDGVAEEFVDVLRHAMATDVDDRYASAEEFRYALESLSLPPPGSTTSLHKISPPSAHPPSPMASPAVVSGPPAGPSPTFSPSPSPAPVPQTAPTGRIPVPGPLVRAPGYPQPPPPARPPHVRPPHNRPPQFRTPGPYPPQGPPRVPPVPPMPHRPVSAGGRPGGYPLPPPPVGPPSQPYSVTAHPLAPPPPHDDSFLGRFTNGQLVLITAGIVVAVGIVVAAIVAVVLIVSN